jgi:membrane protein
VVRDDVRTILEQSQRQDILFVAGALAYATLLAAVPFALLLVSAVGYVLGAAPTVSNDVLLGFLQNLVPAETARAALPLVRALLLDAQETRGSVGLIGAFLFAVFSTRLFGALRAALVVVFEIERGRGILVGKLFDLFYVIVGTILLVLYLGLNLWLVSESVWGGRILEAAGVSAEVSGVIPLFVSRFLVVTFLAAMFTGLYKFLPNRRVHWSSAWWGGLWCAVLFELARAIIFELVWRLVGPSTLYSGTLAILVVVVLWVYYASIIFVVGGAVARAHERRHQSAVPPASLPVV